LSHSHVDTLVVKRIILTFAVGAAALAFALTAPAAAAPDSDDSSDAASSRYDSAEVIRKISDLSRHTDGTASSDRRGTETKRTSHSHTGECADCQPRRRYDDQEVVKKVHNVDRSRVINTVTVVPASPRVREINRLVIRKNEIRNVGVVQHNHIIVEKDIRYVQRVPVTTTVNFVTQNYRVVERPATVSISVAPPRNYECAVGLGRYPGYCRPALRVRG
jgi:hypothetical protein